MVVFRSLPRRTQEQLSRFSLLYLTAKSKKGPFIMNQGNTISPCKTIMVVDDHILFREGLTSLIRSIPDFEVVGSAGSVYEAISLARELSPEIILMDFAMP